MPIVIATVPCQAKLHLIRLSCHRNDARDELQYRPLRYLHPAIRLSNNVKHTSQTPIKNESSYPILRAIARRSLNDLWNLMWTKDRCNTLSNFLKSISSVGIQYILEWGR